MTSDTLENILIPAEWVATYKHALFDLLKIEIGYAKACNIYDLLETNHPHLDFDNPEYSYFYNHATPHKETNK